MLLKEFAAQLGIDSYPEILEQTYEENRKLGMDIADPAILDALEKEYHLFGEYYALLRELTLALKQDPARREWGNAVTACLKLFPMTKKIPTPKSDETPLGDFLPLLILIPHLPSVASLYRGYGFSKEEVERILRSFANIIDATKRRTGRPGYNKSYFNWQKKYVQGILFRFGSFNYELKPFDGAVLLRHRGTGEIRPLVTEGVFHRDGMILGSAGFEDETDSFSASFSETDEFWEANVVKDGLVLPQKEAYSKKEWEMLLSPEDPVISVHIPAQTDLSPEAVEKSYTDGMQFVAEYFPDFCPKAYYCDSWLLDPNLTDILGEKSKIVAFQNRYVKWPIRSAGKEVFSFVFVGFKGEISELPENTSLERGLKKRYLEGKYIHSYQGAFFLS